MNSTHSGWRAGRGTVRSNSDRHNLFSKIPLYDIQTRGITNGPTDISTWLIGRKIIALK